MSSQIDPILSSYRSMYQDVYLLKHPKFSIHLLGTNHLSKLSRDAVRKVISKIKPHCVATELCLRRLEMANVLAADNSFRKEYEILATLPKHQRPRAITELLRLRLIHQALEYSSDQKKQITRVNPLGYKVSAIQVDDISFGEDLFTAFGGRVWHVTTTNPHPLLSNAKTGYKILLIDQPAELTYEKIAHVLNKKEVEAVQKYRKDFIKIFRLSGLTGIMQRIWNSNLQILRVQGRDRDEYLAYAILRATQFRFTEAFEKEPTRIIGLVGRKHVSSIIKIWLSPQADRYIQIKGVTRDKIKKFHQIWKS